MMMPPDLIVHNGTILTMNTKQPSVEALVVRDGMIIAVGNSKEILTNYPEAKQTIDLKGKFVCPGFNDTHTHLLAIGAKMQDVILDKVKSPKEALAMIEERVKKTEPGKWIFGEAWDETTWDEKRQLTLEELDKIAPKNPCYIRRICGHLAAVNSLALKELEISPNDPDLPKDAKTKQPLGIITDTLIDRLAGNPKLKKSQQELDEAVVRACKHANSLGVTSVTDNLSSRSVSSYITAWKKGELTVRVYMNIPRLKFEHYLISGIKTGFGDNFLKIGGVKIFTDGSLGAWTAALNEPYFDKKDTTGGFYIEEKVLKETVARAVNNGWQTAIHGIGDKAIELILKTFESLGSPEVIRKGRHRIEHAEYLLENQLARANELGIILSMQPNFPGRWGRPGQLYEMRLGPERYKKLNNFRTIIDSKAKVSFGSDNMPMDPLLGIWSVVTHPIKEIKLSVEEAIYHFTLGAAYASFEENIKGSLEPGKVADFVILEDNILEIDPEKIKETKVLTTVVGGKVVFQQ